MDKVANTEEMEEMLLAFLLHNKAARDASQAVLDTKHFSSEVHKILLKKIQSLPNLTPRVFKEEVYKYLLKAKMTEEELSHFIETYEKISVPLKTEECRYVEENLNDFVKKQNVKIAFLQSGELFNKGDLGAIVQKLTEAVNSGFQSQDLGMDYINDVELRIQERRNSLASKRVGIGVPELDTMMNGGLTKGQVGLIVGGTGRGKSICLQSIGRHNLVFNQGCIYYTYELSKSLIADRFDVAEARVPLFELKAFEKSVRESIERLKNSTKGSLLIKECIPKKTTVSEIQAHIRLAKAKGMEVDTVLIDYLDLVGPGRRYDDPYHEMDHIVLELVAMAKEENVRIWTASQLNRSGLVAENPDESGIAGAINKLFNVDFAMFLAQTKEERQAQIMRLCVSKNRNGPSNGSVTIDTEYGFFTFFHKMTSMENEEESTHVV